MAATPTNRNCSVISTWQKAMNQQLFKKGSLPYGKQLHHWVKQSTFGVKATCSIEALLTEVETVSHSTVFYNKTRLKSRLNQNQGASYQMLEPFLQSVPQLFGTVYAKNWNVFHVTCVLVNHRKKQIARRVLWLLSHADKRCRKVQISYNALCFLMSAFSRYTVLLTTKTAGFAALKVHKCFWVPARLSDVDGVVHHIQNRYNSLSVFWRLNGYWGVVQKHFTLFSVPKACKLPFQNKFLIERSSLVL